MVGSTRGAAGGYQLVRPPAEITLADVMAVIDGSSGTVASAIGQPTQASEALLHEWQKVADVQQVKHSVGQDHRLPARAETRQDRRQRLPVFEDLLFRSLLSRDDYQA